MAICNKLAFSFVLLFFSAQGISQGSKIYISNQKKIQIFAAADSLNIHYSKTKVPFSRVKAKIRACLKSDSVSVDCVKEALSLLDNCKEYSVETANLDSLGNILSGLIKKSRKVVGASDSTAESSDVLKKSNQIAINSQGSKTNWLSNVLIALVIVQILVIYLLIGKNKRKQMIINKILGRLKEIEAMTNQVWSRLQKLDVKDVGHQAVRKNIDEKLLKESKSLDQINDRLVGILQSLNNLYQPALNTPKKESEPLSVSEFKKDVEESERIPTVSNAQENQITLDVFKSGRTFFLNTPYIENNIAYFDNKEQDPKTSIKTFYKVRLVRENEADFSINNDKLGTIKMDPERTIGPACDFDTSNLLHASLGVDEKNSTWGKIILENDRWRLTAKAKLKFF